MHFGWTAIFGVICFSVGGIQCLALPFEFEEEIDNISDSSDDIMIKKPVSPGEEIEENELIKAPVEKNPPQDPEPCPDPKVYGMNIGLHYVLEDIKNRLVYDDRVHLESLIKVLVLTHKIEQAGGSVEENNKQALKKAVELYPEALKEAMRI